MIQNKKGPIRDFPLDRIIDFMNSKDKLPFVLLGVGPMSELVNKTTLEIARDTGSPAMLIASRNQVEVENLGGGYVDSTDGFVKNIISSAEEIGFKGLLYICRDHGGPWQRSDEKELSAKDAWDRALKSYSADIEAGFNVLHIDPTLSKKSEPAPALNKVVADTVELIAHCAKTTASRTISYEVGTEATAGKTIDPTAFEEFIRNLLNQLKKRKLPHPCLIVGQTGTLVKMDRNVGTVNPAIASMLSRIARKYGMGFKEHNADYLPDFILNRHSQWGITSANVAPEYGVAETKALLALADMEKSMAGSGQIPEDKASDFLPEITDKVIAGNRWKKWLYPDCTQPDAGQIRQCPSLSRHIVEVNGHYVFGDDKVIEQKKKLLANIAEFGLLNKPPEEIIRQAVKASIVRYIDAFGLKNSTTAIMAG